MKTEISNGIGEMFKQTRIASGLKQEDVAKTLNICPTVVSKLESGKSNPTFNTIIKYFDALGCELEITPTKKNY